MNFVIVKFKVIRCQRQRVWIAMVLAQDTEIIFLDEPTTYLDLAHQIDILDYYKS